MIRTATPDDIPALVEFVVEEAREAQSLGLDLEQTRQAVAAAVGDPAKARYWILDDRTGAICVTREWSDWSNADYWWISFVYLVPEVRGRGLVEALVDHVRRAAGQAGAPEVRLYVHPENARAIRAYERLGFRTLAYRIMSIAPLAAAPILDDEALWRAFGDRTLPATQWTHAAHLRIAAMHVARYSLDEAHLQMRVGIIRLNAAHGLVETATRGYHETLTRVWLVLVAAGEAADRDAPLRYYSRDRLFSLAARTRFVEPDLAPLPSAA
jgi:ribosomal protein S18 acetylase RimI-like enzyme